MSYDTMIRKISVRTASLNTHTLVAHDQPVTASTERVGCLVQYLVGPLANTFAGSRSGNADCSMNLRTDPEH
jgi:hypothetical protein